MSDDAKQQMTLSLLVGLILCWVLSSIGFYFFRKQAIDRAAIQAGLSQTVVDGHVIWAKP